MHWPKNRSSPLETGRSPSRFRLSYAIHSVSIILYSMMFFMGLADAENRLGGKATSVRMDGLT
jgi:hypothetical protein